VNYHKFYLKAKLSNPHSLPTWTLLKDHLKQKGKFLEIGPGIKPRIPVKNSFFIETADSAVSKLKKAQGNAFQAKAEKLPFKSNFFDLVCAFDVFEHVKDDKKAFKEVFRVLKKKGILIFSIPLFEKYWSAWDELAGHQRRYEPPRLEKLLQKKGFQVEKFCGLSNPFVQYSNFLFPKRFGSSAIFFTQNLPSKFLTIIDNLFIPMPTLLFRKRNPHQWEKGSLPRQKDYSSLIVFCRKKA
jgi:SAM-dependent methyltransferase